jgi:hypothetical protein
LNAAPRAARKLPGRSRGPAHDGGDFIEGHVEHVMQHERDPLGQSQGLKHHKERETDGIGHERLVLRIAPAEVVSDGMGAEPVEERGARDGIALAVPFSLSPMLPCEVPDIRLSITHAWANSREGGPPTLRDPRTAHAVTIAKTAKSLYRGYRIGHSFRLNCTALNRAQANLMIARCCIDSVMAGVKRAIECLRGCIHLSGRPGKLRNLRQAWNASWE